MAVNGQPEPADRAPSSPAAATADSPAEPDLAAAAARALFTGADAHDDEADRSGISVDREPDPHVTARIVVAAAPPPRRTAEQVHSAVERALSQVTGPGLMVTVVVVDVET